MFYEYSMTLRELLQSVDAEAYASIPLYENLEASISLYRKLGFKEIPLSGNAYERCDILMELIL